MTVDADLRPRKTQLLFRKAELLDRMRRIEDDLDMPADPDWEENAVQMEDDEVLERLGHASQQEIKALDAALERIAAGTYGTCARCGAEIDSHRLDLLPHTPLCRHCAS